MELFKYKCIPLLFKVTMDEDFLSDTAMAYEKVLNKAAEEGWQFVRIDTVSSDSSEENYEATTISTAEKICSKVFIFRKKIISDFNQTEKNNFNIFQNITRCPSCHNEVSKEDIYCENCARKLK